MKLVVRKHIGGDASPAQHEAVEKALNAVLAESRFTFDDAMLAMDEIIRRAEIEEGDPEEPFEPFHEERMALYDQMMAAAAQAAGEPVYFFRIEDGEDPARFL